MQKCLNCGHEFQSGAKFCPECGTKCGASNPARASLVGSTLSGKYRILREIGSGGMGTVYLAEHTSLKKQVAVKVLHPDLYVSSESIQRFQREGIAAGQFTHSGAIQIFDFDEDERGFFFLAMEYVDGQSLSQLLAAEGALPLERAIGITAQILRVLAEAHEHGIVHRDLKPDNIMVLTSESGDQVKVLDFGLSKLVDVPLDASLMTQTGRIMGTPQYMSPEQCRGKEVDARSDLYSVGLILYELLSGEPTFGGESIPEILVKQSTQAPVSLIDTRPELEVPADLEDCIERALRKEAAERFADARQMLAALEGVRRDYFRRPRRSLRLGSARARAWVVALSVLLLVGFSLARHWPFSQARGAAALLSSLPAEKLGEQEASYVGYLREARRALRQRDVDVALVSVEDALRLPCCDAEAYFTRAQVQAARGDEDAARADAEEALRLFPAYAEVHAWLGWRALEAGQAEQAQAGFDRALELDEGCALAQAGKGAAALAAMELPVAEAYLRRAVELDDQQVQAHSLLGRLFLERGELPAAVTAFVRAKRADASYAPAWAGLGEAYLAQGRVDEAVEQLLRAIERRPDDLSSRRLLAGAMIDQGRAGEARTLLEDSIARFPEDDELAYLWAAVRAEDEPIEAIAVLKKALEERPRAKARLLLGNLLLEEGRDLEALQCLDAALEAASEEGVELAAPARLWRDKGLALFRLARYEEAIASFEQAARLDPRNPRTFLDLGILQMVFTADTELARLHFDRYLELGGDDRRVQGWLDEL